MTGRFGRRYKTRNFRSPEWPDSWHLPPGNLEVGTTWETGNFFWICVKTRSEFRRYEPENSNIQYKYSACLGLAATWPSSSSSSSSSSPLLPSLGKAVCSRRIWIFVSFLWLGQGGREGEREKGRDSQLRRQWSLSTSSFSCHPKHPKYHFVLPQYCVNHLLLTRRTSVCSLLWLCIWFVILIVICLVIWERCYLHSFLLSKGARTHIHTHPWHLHIAHSYAHSGYWIHWVVLLAMLFTLIVIDFLFLGDNQFIFDQNWDSWKARAGVQD